MFTEFFFFICLRAMFVKGGEGWGKLDANGSLLQNEINDNLRIQLQN